jgi:hypothetical protein
MASKRKSSGSNTGKKRVAMRNLKGKKEALTDKESTRVKGGGKTVKIDFT